MAISEAKPFDKAVKLRVSYLIPTSKADRLVAYCIAVAQLLATCLRVLLLQSRRISSSSTVSDPGQCFHGQLAV